MKDEFFKSGTLIDESLQKAVDAYRHANSFVRFEDSGNWDSIARTIGKLSPSRRNEWAVLWEGVASKLEKIPFPASYLTLIDELHGTIHRSIKKNYADQNSAQFSFQERIGFMQHIADVQTGFWHEKFPDVFADFKGTKVVPFYRHESAEKHPNQFSLWPDTVSGQYYYRVPDTHTNMTFLGGVAAHEPEHSTQFHLMQKLKDGIVLPEPLREVAKIFSIYELEGMEDFPPTLAWKDNRPYDRLGEALFETYLRKTIEISTFHLGNRMERTMLSLFPALNVFEPLVT